MPVAFIAKRNICCAGASSLAVSVRAEMAGTTPIRSDEATADEANLARQGDEVSFDHRSHANREAQHALASTEASRFVVFASDSVLRGDGPNQRRKVPALYSHSAGPVKQAVAGLSG